MSIGGICKPRWLFIPVTSEDAGKQVRIVKYDKNADNAIFLDMYYGDAFGIKDGYVAQHRIYYYFTILLAGIAGAVYT